METNPLRRQGILTAFDLASGKWKNWVRIGAGLICLLAVFSQHPLDPSPYNLFKSYEGVHNWLGFPGAFIGGFLVDHWGSTAYALPILWMFTIYRRNLGLGWGLLLDGFIVTLAAVATSLILAANSWPLLRYTGLVGYLSGHYLSQLPGSLLCWSIIIGFFIRHRHDYRLNPQVPLRIYNGLAVMMLILIDAMRFLAIQLRILSQTITAELPKMIRPIMSEWQIRIEKRIRQTLPNLKKKAAAPPTDAIVAKIPSTSRRLASLRNLLPKRRDRAIPSVATPPPASASAPAGALHNLLKKYENDLLSQSLATPIMRPETANKEG